MLTPVHGLETEPWGACQHYKQRYLGVMTALPEAAYNIPDAGAAWQIRRSAKEYDKGSPRQFGFYVMKSHHTGAASQSKSDTTRWRHRLPARSCDLDADDRRRIRICVQNRFLHEGKPKMVPFWNSWFSTGPMSRSNSPLIPNGIVPQIRWSL